MVIHDHKKYPSANTISKTVTKRKRVPLESPQLQIRKSFFVKKTLTGDGHGYGDKKNSLSGDCMVMTITKSLSGDGTVMAIRKSFFLTSV